MKFYTSYKEFLTTPGAIITLYREGAVIKFSSLTELKRVAKERSLYFREHIETIPLREGIVYLSLYLVMDRGEIYYDAVLSWENGFEEGGWEENLASAILKKKEAEMPPESEAIFRWGEGFIKLYPSQWERGKLLVEVYTKSAYTPSL